MSRLQICWGYHMTQTTQMTLGVRQGTTWTGHQTIAYTKTFTLILTCLPFFHKILYHWILFFTPSVCIFCIQCNYACSSVYAKDDSVSKFFSRGPDSLLSCLANQLSQWSVPIAHMILIMVAYVMNVLMLGLGLGLVFTIFSIYLMVTNNIIFFNYRCMSKWKITVPFIVKHNVEQSLITQ